MTLKPDFQDALQYFIFSNLPVLMNPTNAANVAVSEQIIPTTPTTPIATALSTDTSTLLIISPDLLKALQSYTINNFPDIGLPQDIQQVVKDFFVNLPPIIPMVPTTTAEPVTPATS